MYKPYVNIYCVFAFSLSFFLPPIPFPFFLLLYYLFFHLFPIFLFCFLFYSLPLPLQSSFSQYFPFFPCLFVLLSSSSPSSIIIFPPLPPVSPYLSSTLHCLSRYYAICCQPLVYRSKMTPVRIALMLGGCWAIPMFISFLPIMQGWNKIGILDVVSIHTEAMGLATNQLC